MGHQRCSSRRLPTRSTASPNSLEPQQLTPSTSISLNGRSPTRIGAGSLESPTTATRPAAATSSSAVWTSWGTPVVGRERRRVVDRADVAEVVVEVRATEAQCFGSQEDLVRAGSCRLPDVDDLPRASGTSNGCSHATHAVDRIMLWRAVQRAARAYDCRPPPEPEQRSRMREPVFTETMQISIVVRDLDATMRAYVDEYGIGPGGSTVQPRHRDRDGEGWSAGRLGLSDRSDRSRQRAMGADRAAGRQEHYAEFLATKGVGLHHIAVGTAHYGEALDTLQAKGRRVLQGGVYNGVTSPTCRPTKILASSRRSSTGRQASCKSWTPSIRDGRAGGRSYRSR